MASVTIDFKNKEFIGTIALIGIILMVLAVFMTWFDGPEGVSATGFNIFDLSDDETSDWQKMIPMIITIFGVIALVLEFISILVPGTSSKIDAVLPIIVFIFSLISVIFVIMFATWDYVDDLGSHYSVGAGCWIAMIGALIGLCSTAGQTVAAIKSKTA